MDTVYDGNAKINTVNKHVFVWVCNFLVGGFGVDRFIRGQIGLGLFKLFIGSWITLGIWPFVDFVIALVKAYGSNNHSNELTFINGRYAN
ncbi:TM2 domain-containing protein [Fructobacillus evanidus]|uniref:TM2 domain n=1 Tax=Fructobacillus evanidus TaxID=3064281 RepID=A0ABN9YN99_9LACO|nr:TM2 domain [Fructobacillus sp. LMG 32999]CAK1230462.1 TM2 domain [Fructobacillus sp. LMG 32999]CAK1234101.1 TM2 domain [Fructobacillus sp. LMG 32999]CAK1234469.1 TM2 domain [Fructobacillus sp. LMG 32999]CAK1248126.1 TM2 domain [Fructobacillus sp. LMG 32999]